MRYCRINGTLDSGPVCRDAPYFRDEFDVERMILLNVLDPNILQVDLRHFVNHLRPFNGANALGNLSGKKKIETLEISFTLNCF